jgi:hypothetical protein
MKTHLATIICSVLPWSAAHSTEINRKAFPAEGLKIIQVETESGDVQVGERKAADILVAVQAKDLKDCKITMEAKNDTLFLKAEGSRRWLWSSDHCDASFLVNTPRNLAIKAFTGSGNASVSDLDGVLTLGTGSGDIHVKNVTGQLTLRTGSGAIDGDARSSHIQADTGSGDISLTSLLGSAEIKIGSGHVSLAWAQAPQTAAVNIKAGSGDIALAFPEDSRLTTAFRSGSGEVHNEFGDTTGAGVQVAVTTGSGDLSIKKQAASK